MIHNDEQFQDALETATVQMADPPSEGTVDHRQLMDLLKQIAGYRPAIIQAAKDPSSDDRSHLADELKTFEAQMPHHYSDHWHTLVSDI
jgi:hypothetical protein